MARINLLPWRQEERLRKNKEFNIVLAAAAILAILATLLTYAFFNRQFEAQLQANQMIETENARLDKVNEEIATLEQQRDEMTARMKLIQDLQGKRSIPVRVWDDIARSIPSAMYLVRMSRVDDTITIEGFADNANVVSQLVRNLDASPWLADSRIPNIQSKVEAYQNTIARPQTKDGQPRQPYPEDNYIGFTVTTVVKSEEPKPADGTDDPNAPTDTAAPTDANAQPVATTDVNANQAATEQTGDATQPAPTDVAQPVAPAPEQAVPAPAPAPADAAQSAPQPVAEAAPAPAPAGGQ